MKVTGEDGLTMLALQELANNGRFLKEIKKKFEIEKIEAPVEAFYRPSFGRGKLPKFGEFDAIIRIGHHIILVEAKADFSTEASDWKILDKQLRRHRILRLLLEAKRLPSAKAKIGEYTVPGNSELRARINAFRKELKCEGMKIHDLLLVFYSRNRIAVDERVPTDAIEKNLPKSFKVIRLPYKRDGLGVKLQ